MTEQKSGSNWWDAYPAFKSSAPLIAPEDLAALLRAKDESLAVIDVRRNDHAVRLCSSAPSILNHSVSPI